MSSEAYEQSDDETEQQLDNENAKVLETSPLHINLDLQGRKAIFKDMSIEMLTDYCIFAHREFECASALEASNFFSSRYGWDISIRMDDIMLAWAKVERKETAPQKKEEKSKEVLTTKASTGNSSSIPIVMKASSIDKVLLCQLDDPDLHFSGDSGAIGRFVCNPESLRLDLKGRQYKGTLTSGPTIFILNLSNPQSAKVETVTNEFCHLTFERDQHSSLQGVYSGAGGAGGGLNYDDSALDDIVPLHRQKSKGNDDNEDSTTQANAPKISTITNKKRRQSSTKTTAKKKSKK